MLRRMQLATDAREAVMSDEQPINEKIEVEGHAKRFFKDPAEQTAAQVQGHGFARKRGEDAEAPGEDAATADENREAADAEVEGHAKRFFRDPAD
jgi:hypothetical protein